MKKIISLICAGVMTLTLLAVTAFAAQTELGPYSIDDSGFTLTATNKSRSIGLGSQTVDGLKVGQIVKATGTFRYTVTVNGRISPTMAAPNSSTRQYVTFNTSVLRDQTATITWRKTDANASYCSFTYLNYYRLIN